MKRLLVVCMCISLVGAFGCEFLGMGGDAKEEAKGDSEAVKKPDDAAKADDGAKPADAAKADEGAKAADAAKPADGAKPADAAKPTADPAAAEQCGKILDKAFAAIEPGLKKLGIEDPASMAEDYKKGGKNFLERCALLDQEKRDCLEKAENPLAGIRTCKVNEGKKPNEKLWAVSMRSHIKFFETEALEEKAAKKLLASLRGRWVNDWKKIKLKTTWKIDKSGNLVETKVSKGKEPEKREGIKVSFKEKGKMHVHWNETSTQAHNYLRAGKKMFFATGNLVYGAYPMKNKKNFVVKDSSNYVISEKGKCSAVGESGEMTKAKCKWAKAKGKKVLKVSYAFDGDVLPSGKPRKQERTYYLLAKHLVHESMFETGKFMKK